MANLNYLVANPRLVFIMPIAADTPITLKDAILAFLHTNAADLFDSDVLAENAFTKNISWNIKEPSSIGRSGGAGSLYYVTKFRNPSDGVLPSDAAYYGTYGIQVLDMTERTVTGHAECVILYSEAGTNVLVDLVFEPGS